MLNWGRVISVCLTTNVCGLTVVCWVMSFTVYFEMNISVVFYLYITSLETSNYGKISRAANLNTRVHS